MTVAIPPLYQKYAVDFQKQVVVKETVDINKSFKSLALIKGNVGNANADANRDGVVTKAEADAAAAKLRATRTH